MRLIPSISKSRRSADDTDLSLVVVDNPKASRAEAYRTLRTNLQFAAVSRPIRSLLVTSSLPAEGKTTVVANLGAAYAQAGVKTLVVGADLRLPTIHKFFGLGNDVGLTNVLVGHRTLEDAVQQASQVDGLSVLCGGAIPPNPTELLSSTRMQHLVQEMTEHYEMVIFDLPPVTMVADASAMSRWVDGSLLVVRIRLTPRALAQQSANQLRQIDGRLIGVVATAVNRSGGYSAYNYYSYYSYYEAEERRFAGSKQAAATRDS